MRPVGQQASQRFCTDTVSLFLGDCNDILPDLPVFDLILTDPPFGIGNFVQTSGNQTGRRSHRGKPVEWNCSKGVRPETFDLIRAKSKHRVIWGANFFNCFEENGGAIVWLKRQRMPNFSKAEIASCTHYKKTEIVDIAWSNFDASRLAETDHACERPVELYAWCIRYMPKAESICDPFMGSGSSCIAAIRAGIKYTGIERDPKWFGVAHDRIERFLRQGKLI